MGSPADAAGQPPTYLLSQIRLSKGGTELARTKSSAITIVAIGLVVAFLATAVTAAADSAT